MLLAGDIGGTKTNLAIIDPAGGVGKTVAEATFPSGRYPSLESIVQQFLNQTGIEVRRASFGVAGPVVGGRATITNLPWVMDEHNLLRAFDLDAVYLLNDLVSIAYAVPHLEGRDLHVLNEGRPEPGGAIAVLAPGTGLGEAFLTWEGTRFSAHPSEGGHADFAPINKLQIKLLRYLHDRFDHVSYERICSGMGLPNIYRFFKDTGAYEEPDWLAERLASASDLTPVIVTAAFDEERPCPLCQATLEMFVAILGAEAGNLALKVLSTGGVYLAGGIPPRILPALEKESFMDAFLRKGRLSHLLAPMPVRVVLNSKAALLGAIHYGMEMWDK
ncbi:MAG TPA: glucokinase [Anaerolineae bacterium]|nr:glucokinase [Anaerolineae bacterium]HRT32688.1 glucokinase [Anaerolineae bacterium]HXK43228.1 glucokinase [Anaerolineae bacterium]